MCRAPSVVSTAQWPAERFYWSVLIPPSGACIRPGPLPAGLRPAFDEVVPEPDESEAPSDADGRSRLHVVCTPLSDGRLVACAAPAALLHALNPAVLVLTPDELPEFVMAGSSADGTECGDVSATTTIATSLNLLVGDFEPAPFRRARASRRILALAGLVVVCVAVTLGLSRRAALDRAFAQEAKDRSEEVTRAIGESLGVRGLRSEALSRALSRASQAAEAASRISPAADASGALSDLLAAWPPDAGCSPQTLIVADETVVVAVSIDDDAAAFLRRLMPALRTAGWSLDEPRLTNLRGVTRLNLCMRRREHGGGEAGQ